ncbi:hypothetical protein HQ520_10255 [bacterium]|nr:hypothetical protein [bacterium]
MVEDPSPLLLWIRRHRLVLTCLYLTLLVLVSLAALSVLFDGPGSGRIIAKLEAAAQRYVAHRQAGWWHDLEQARELVREERYADAERRLLVLLKRLPQRARLNVDAQVSDQTLLLLAEVNEHLGHRRRSEQAYHVLLDRNPDYARENTLYGLAELNGGNDRRGERHLRRALAHDPNHYPAVRALVERYAATGEPQKAVEAWEAYTAAFSMASGMEQADNGIRFMRGSRDLAAVKFMPIVNGHSREYILPAGIAEQEAEETFDALALALEFPPECAEFSIESIRLLPRRRLTDQFPRPLASFTDFDQAALDGFESTGENTFRLTDETRRLRTLRLVLPEPLRLGNIDHVQVRFAARKKMEPEILALVELARSKLAERAEDRP